MITKQIVYNSNMVKIKNVISNLIVLFQIFLLDFNKEWIKF